jgi:hypothetical protein
VHREGHLPDHAIAAHGPMGTRASIRAARR